MNDNKKRSEDLDSNVENEKPSISQDERDKIKNAIEKMAEGSPEKWMEFMSTTMEMGSIVNPLHQKITEEHISRALDLVAQNDKRSYESHENAINKEFEDRKSVRRYSFAIFLCLLALVVIVLLLFKNSPDILVPALTAIISFSGGFLGGWGFGKKSSS